MHHQTLQLPVADPLGFADYRSFTSQVKQALGNNTNLAPLPLSDFMPIRSGTMRVHKLRVIDSFGQEKTDILLTSVIKSEPLTLPGTAITHTHPNDAWLPPRLMQPARINFRWLSADSGSQELNSHPESTPVYGWLLANHLGALPFTTRQAQPWAILTLKPNGETFLVLILLWLRKTFPMPTSEKWYNAC